MVGTTCWTPCAGSCSGSKRGLMMSGKRARISGKFNSEMLGDDDDELDSTMPPSGNRRQLLLTSMRRECFLKKSAPKIGLATLATRKQCRAEKPGSSRDTDFLPNVSINVPLAARRRWPGRGVGDLLLLLLSIKDKGNTEMSAPLSTKKEHCDAESKTDKEPEDSVVKETMPGVTDARRWRFPGLDEHCQAGI